MADSILSITVRDRRHPCAPYRDSGHSFAVQIFHCDGTPLFWKGVNFGTPFLLNVKGAGGGLIHAQVKVPPGCYLIRGVATCNNVITDWAWAEVCCDETVCVELVIPTLFYCILRMTTALRLGTVALAGGEDVPLGQIAPREAQEALEALNKLVDRLPRDPALPEPPTAEEIKRAIEGHGPNQPGAAAEEA